ncbi:hypothetical protein N5079_29665 [Planotetraspora sp. A-T 1434]|uniref:hypothetical protein n=1 Tax=Planotetraspora sp. A-T 1434 TaxID=2979219 RepID=UPI0021BEE432|nr:hypothetical protein [Planotetraspora sp. A-T 1434]MCT9934380.1 hypothetical protein [Planotetraspora sp. A-T 1434]
MSRRFLGGAAAAASAAALLLTFSPASPASAASTTSAASAASPGSAASAQAAPAGVAKKLFKAWLSGDRDAAGLVASPSAVKTLFSYVYRAPDEFGGCAGNACRFVHTSVHVPGGLNGILMIVSGSKVAKVYESRHLTTPSAPAKYLFKAWQQGDRNRGLEVATGTAVKTLFHTKYDPKGVTYFFQGCTAEPKGYSCAYSYDGGAMLMHVRGSKTRGYDVRSISYIAD